MGIKLGFSIKPDVFGYGLLLPHYGTIVVGDNTIGNYAVLHTSTCISGNEKVIGNGFYLSTGARITSKVNLGNGITVAANAVVTNSYVQGNVLVGGIPAVPIKDRKIWYEEENDIYIKRVKHIEELKQLMAV